MKTFHRHIVSMFAFPIAFLKPVSLVSCIKIIAMNKVGILDLIFKPFQLVGLQSFSLRSLSGKTSKYPPIYYQIFLLALFAQITYFGFSYYKAFTSSHGYKTSSDLQWVSVLMNLFSNVISVDLCFIVTVLNHNQFLRFFQKSNEISMMCLNSFNYRTSFKKVAWYMSFWMLLQLAITTKLIVHDLLTSLSIEDMLEDGSFYAHLKTTNPFMQGSWFVIYIVVDLLYVKFNFLVRIVNFHLEVLQSLLHKDILFDPAEVAKRSKTHIKRPVQIVTTLPVENIKTQKIIKLRKMYMLLLEMTAIINDTLGFLILIRILMEFNDTVLFGYTLMRGIHKAKDLIGEIRKWLLIR